MVNKFDIKLDKERQKGDSILGDKKISILVPLIKKNKDWSKQIPNKVNESIAKFKNKTP